MLDDYSLKWPVCCVGYHAKASNGCNDVRYGHATVRVGFRGCYGCYHGIRVDHYDMIHQSIGCREGGYADICRHMQTYADRCIV